MSISRIDNEGLTGPIGGRSNLVTNGAITINQRGEQTGVTSTTYVTDRIQHILGTAGTWSISKSSDAPDGLLGICASSLALLVIMLALFGYP